MKTLKTLLAAAALVMITCTLWAQEEAAQTENATDVSYAITGPNFSKYTTAPEAEEEGQQPEISYGVSGGVFSKYIWRGIVITNEPVFQFEGWATVGPLTFDVWNNMDLSDDNFSAGDITETDLTVEYAFSLLKVDCALGYIYYTFPHWRADDTQELYGTAAVDCLLAPSLDIYWDIDEVGGIYAVGGVSHSLEIPVAVGGENLSLDLSAAAGYGNSNYVAGYFASVGSGWVDLLLSVETSIDCGNGFTLSPSVSYQQVLDNDIRRNSADSDTVVAGITLTKEF